MNTNGVLTLQCRQTPVGTQSSNDANKVVTRACNAVANTTYTEFDGTITRFAYRIPFSGAGKP